MVPAGLVTLFELLATGGRDALVRPKSALQLAEGHNQCKAGIGLRLLLRASPRGRAKTDGGQCQQTHCNHRQQDHQGKGDDQRKTSVPPEPTGVIGAERSGFKVHEG